MGRSPCCEKAHTNKGAWTKEEDQRLIAYIRAHGEGSWRSLPKTAGGASSSSSSSSPSAPPDGLSDPINFARVLALTGLLRCGKSCRLRWINYLRPDLKRGNFTEEEDDLIIKLHEMLGNKWSLIAGRLPGRTDNEIKNYWNTHIKRKLLSRGLDPQTHRPIDGAAKPQVSILETTEEASNSATNLEVNLDLSIRLPFYPSAPAQSSSSNEASDTMATSASAAAAAAAEEVHQPFRPAVCLRHHLGFHRDETCVCQTVANSHTIGR